MLKLFLYFLFCAICKYHNTLKAVPKEISHHPKAVLAVVEVSTVAVVLGQQTRLLMTKKTQPE